jgi:glycosyltransferase involved in cell wall biosynthesis
MSFAYLMNAYPMTSTTFIRREIEAHERAGCTVDRFAIRPWDVALVDPQDIAEAQRVTYLLGGGARRLLGGFLTETLKNPVGMARALASTAHLIAKAKQERWKNLAYLLEAVSLKRQALARGISHIHTHFSSNSAAVAMLSHRLGGPGYSVTVHGPDELYVLEENAVARKLEHAAFFAVITEYCRGVVDEQTGGAYADKLHIVRCGLDLQEFDAPSDVPEGQVLVCVGRLCAAKAQHLLVEALARVVDRHPGVRLVLIGDGDTRPRIKQAIADHGLQANVELAGWRTNEQVREALKGARALALPSLAEGLPIVIMESFALGRPVLSTVINGIPELVDDSCGWLAAPGDVDALVPALEALLAADRETLSEMGRIGRARIEQFHDQDANAARLRDLIAQAIAGKVEAAPRRQAAQR